MTFTQRQLELIDQWHQLPRTDERSNWPLHKFLGLTWEEYKVVAATSLVIENPQVTYSDALDIVETGRTGDCGCPIESKMIRILRHTRECSQWQAAERWAGLIDEEYEEEPNARIG